MSTEETPNIEPIDRSKILKKEKLELEIKEVRISYFKKTIASPAFAFTTTLCVMFRRYRNFQAAERS